MSAPAAAFAAAREVYLPSVWVGYGLPLRRKTDKRFESQWSPCCGDSERGDAASVFKANSGEWRYHCFRCGKGGTSIDLVTFKEGCTSLQAARRLAGISHEEVDVPDAPRPTTSAAITDADRLASIATLVAAIRKGHVHSRVRDYLLGRSISASTIDEAIRRGIVRGLPPEPGDAEAWLRAQVGVDCLQKAGMLKGRWTAAAFRPLVFLPAGATCLEFRPIGPCQTPKALQYGHQEFPVIWRPSAAVRRVMVVEGGVDLLSMVDMGYGTDHLILGVLGCSAWRDAWVSQIRDKYPDAEWVAAHDADQSGDLAADELLAHLDSLQIPAQRLAPPPDADWNQMLQSL